MAEGQLEPRSTQGGAQGDLRSIQYLRGVAALGVLVFHAAERAGGAFGLGAAGVDVFFVISGFIMWAVTSRRPTSPGRFLIRRVQRIVPLYWGLTLAVVAVAVAIPTAFPVLNPTIETTLKSLLFIPYRDTVGLTAPLIVPGWTLNYEMFFYAIFALGLFAPSRLRPWLITAALAALVAARPLGDPNNPLWATYTDPLLLEFGAGVWLGKAWLDDRLPGLRVGFLLLALGVIGFAAVELSGIDVERTRALFWGVPALLMVAGAVTVERHGRVPDWRALRAIGDASYSLYLIHGLVISATVRLLSAVGLATPTMILLSGLFVGVIAGLVAYQLVEKPLARLFARGFQRGGTAPAKPTFDQAQQ